MSEKIRTANDVIDALGGTGAVAALRGVGAPAVSMWRTNGIPGDHHLPLLRIAEQRGIVVPDDAFRTITVPDDAFNESHPGDRT